jgi:hypothetical protein
MQLISTPGMSRCQKREHQRSGRCKASAHARVRLRTPIHTHATGTNGEALIG